MQHTEQESERSQTLLRNQPFVYWQANQVIITFDVSTPPPRSKEGVKHVITSLKLDALDQFLATRGFQLKSFTTKDVPHPEQPSPEEKSREERERLEEELEQLEAEVAWLEHIFRPQSPFSGLRGSEPYKTPGQRDLEELEQEIERRKRLLQSDGTVSGDEAASGERPSNALNSPVGKYFFASSTGHGTLGVCCFNVVNPTLAPAASRYGHSKGEPTASDTTQAIVTLLNHNLNTLRKDGEIPITSATPNWIGGVTGGRSANCPADPPIPLTGDNTAYNNWHFKVPQLSATMAELDGDGVTVFVLDTIPKAKHIRAAAQDVGTDNLLLKDFAANMAGPSPAIVIDYQSVPKRLTGVHTGKDLNDQFYGFEMPDHGLFVAGIIHDLAPKAKIECVRVLNDSGIGDIVTLCAALQGIQERMAQGMPGKVVVNLSLVITPPDEYLPGIWFGNDHCFRAQDLAAAMRDIELLRVGLHSVIKSLVTQGAVVVASAGNESDMNKNPQRFGPRHPAAFQEVISVGSVDNNGQATTYSDYPALPPEQNGIATYGGAIPQPLPQGQPQEPPGARTWADVKDAVVGIYSWSHYPMLLVTDEPPDYYHAPQSSHCWAYWSGTSFSTPIISALAARVLEAQNQGSLPTNMSVQSIITTAPGQQLLTTGGSTTLPSNTGFGVGIGMLKAYQEHS